MRPTYTVVFFVTIEEPGTRSTGYRKIMAKNRFRASASAFDKEYLMLKPMLAALLFSACARPVLRTLPIPEPDCSWGTLPLTVQVDPAASEYRASVHDAMRAWDGALGRRAFIWSYNDEVPPDVVVVRGPGSGGLDPSRFAGETVTVCERGRATSVVFLLRPLDITERIPIATHELGHTLGLGHSQHPDSVMQPRLDVGLMVDNPRAYRILALDARVALALHPN